MWCPLGAFTAREKFYLFCFQMLTVGAAARRRIGGVLSTRQRAGHAARNKKRARQKSTSRTRREEKRGPALRFSRYQIQKKRNWQCTKISSFCGPRSPSVSNAALARLDPSKDRSEIVREWYSSVRYPGSTTQKVLPGVSRDGCNRAHVYLAAASFRRRIIPRLVPPLVGE